MDAVTEITNFCDFKNLFYELQAHNSVYHVMMPGEPKKNPPPYDFCWYYSNAWEFLYEILHDC